jgi:membrane protein DedA with SNARE-associated domain
MDINTLVSEWGYLAIFVIVALGSVGIPVPEEAVLLLSGYFAWSGDLELSLVITVGIISTITGDNIGYWVGRLYGRHVAALLARAPRMTPERFEAARGLLRRHGAHGVFAARFIAGLRLLAGPLAGVIGLPFPVFLAANALGAVVYVPITVGIGYLIGNRVGAHGALPVTIAVAALVVGGTVAWRIWRSRRLAAAVKPDR